MEDRIRRAMEEVWGKDGPPPSYNNPADEEWKSQPNHGICEGLSEIPDGALGVGYDEGSKTVIISGKQGGNQMAFVTCLHGAEALVEALQIVLNKASGM